MKQLLTACIALLISSGAAAKDDEYRSRWVIHPLIIGFGMQFPHYGALSDSLHAAGFKRLPSVMPVASPGLEIYHRRFVFCYDLNSCSALDTMQKQKGRYNFIQKSRFSQHSFSIGYNCLQPRRISEMVLIPKIGFYWSRLKVTATNYDGDTELMRSAYGIAPQEVKTIRRWESGLAASVKFSCSPFKHAPGYFRMLSGLNVGTETGITHHIGLFGNRAYDIGNKTPVAMPEENRTSFYMELVLEFARGSIFLPKETRKKQLRKVIPMM